MINLRAHLTKKGVYSLYLDIHQNKKRIREFLSIYVSEDYTSPRIDVNGQFIFDEKGKPKNKNIKAIDRDKWNEALKILEFKAQELRNQENGIIPTYREKADFLEFFKNLAEKKNNQSYEYGFKHFKDFVATNCLPFKSVTTDLIKGYQNYLLKSWDSNTAYIYFLRLQIAWNQAIKENITSKNPFKGLDKIKTIEPEKEYLEFSELQKMNDTPTKFKPVIRQAFLFACFTGLRISDIYALTWNNIQNGKISIRQKKSNKSVLEIPISETAQTILDQLQKIGDKVFFGLTVNESFINQKIRDWAKQAGINKHLSFHCARHTFGTLALTYDADIYTVSKLLGHRNLATTQIYAKIIDKKKDEAINKLPIIKM